MDSQRQQQQVHSVFTPGATLVGPKGENSILRKSKKKNISYADHMARTDNNNTPTDSSPVPVGLLDLIIFSAPGEIMREPSSSSTKEINIFFYIFTCIETEI